jgi:hypothetical protein
MPAYHYEEQVEERAKALEKSKKLLHGANRNLESLLQDTTLAQRVS